MPSLKFDKFGGQIPVFDDRLLPIENSSFSKDAFLQSGRLEPLAADVEIHLLNNPAARYAFRVPINVPSIDSILDSYWLEFEDVNTTVVRSPVTTTAEGGIYYWANSSNPPGYTTKTRIAASNPALVLGIPRPAVAPGVTPGAVGTSVTRGYVYTWVSQYGEEGQPSPPTVGTGGASSAWDLTLTGPTVADQTGRVLTHTNIYRTETGLDGVANFFFVDQIPIGTLTYSDNVAPDVVASSDILPSTDWSAPPTDLKGMVSMPNGMIAGWRENEVWFCEPFRPHAWPVKYVVNVESPIVGLGTIDQNLMILTAGQPYTATGVHPSVMALRKVQPIEPCTSQGSIVSTPNGVLYTSNNGLILIGPGGANNLTFEIIRKDDWLKIINLSTVHASYFMGGYYCFSGIADAVFQADAFQMGEVPVNPANERAFQANDFEGTQEGFHLSVTDARLGLMTITAESPTFNVMTDLWTGETLVLRNARIYHVDRRQPTPRRPYLWRSKVFDLNYVDNFAAAKIDWGLPPGAAPSGATMFRYYVDDRLRFSRPLAKSHKQFRLPSGFKANTVQFELEGEHIIYSMEVATSAHELRQV